MAATDHQRIHPVDLEAARPTVPLVPRNLSKSENGDPESKEFPPPFRRTIPLNHSKPPKSKRSCCCRCICWTICLLILLVIIVGAIGGILYAVFRPKLPDYSIDRLRITDFQLDNNMSLYARFDVRITSKNPNEKIGIYYENGSHLSVWYSEAKLCEGSLPKFYQGHQNTTVLDVILTGQNSNATEILTALTQEQQKGSIPLNVRVKVPVRVKLGKLKLMKVKFLGKCNVEVDSVSANNLINIRASNCKFKFRL